MSFMLPSAERSTVVDMDETWAPADRGSSDRAHGVAEADWWRQSGPAYPGQGYSAYPAEPVSPLGRLASQPGGAAGAPPDENAYRVVGPGVPAPRRDNRGRLAAGLLALVVVSGAAGGAVGALVADSHGSATAASSTQASASSDSTTTAAAAAGTVSAAAAKITPSVVTINDDSGRESDVGSGVIIRSDGYIMTNAHVVSSGGQITVVLQDGSRNRGTVVGADATADIAVVKIDKTGLTAATFADSSTVSVGDLVVAVGSPLGLTDTVTSGIVSALNRQVDISSGELGVSGGRASYKAIQTDAALNPGNSGGALVNAAGQLIGVPSSIASTGSSSTFPGQQSAQSGNIGVGFAIPSNTAKAVAEKIIGG